jgi:hypothetical protein
VARTKHLGAATFIVRLWPESSERPEDAWRGQVEHVQSSDKRYVQEMDQIVEFIEQHFGSQPANSIRRGIV